jgi:hypothetical protein
MLACLSGCRANIGNSTRMFYECSTVTSMTSPTEHNLNCCLGGGTTTCSPKTVGMSSRFLAKYCIAHMVSAKSIITGIVSICRRPASKATDQMKDSGCPQAYAYAMDDQSGAQSTAPCPGVKNTDYTVTFCPFVHPSLIASTHADEPTGKTLSALRHPLMPLLEDRRQWVRTAKLWGPPRASVPRHQVLLKVLSIRTFLNSE